MLKSIAVVVGSYLLSVVLVLATDPLLSRLFPGDFVNGRVPSDNALIASTALFVVVSILCAWLCARFAPGRAARHVAIPRRPGLDVLREVANSGPPLLWFFIIGEAMGIGAIIPNWSKGWPHWYWLSWLLTWPVSCWIGLQLARRRAESPSA